MRIPPAHESGGLAHGHRRRIGPRAGQAVVGADEPAGRLHLLTPEDQAVGVVVLRDDGQPQRDGGRRSDRSRGGVGRTDRVGRVGIARPRTRADRVIRTGRVRRRSRSSRISRRTRAPGRPGTAPDGRAGSVRSRGRSISIADAAGAIGSIDAPVPGDFPDGHDVVPDGGGLQAQEAGRIEIARRRGEDSVGEMKRHHGAPATASRPAGLADRGQAGEGAGLQGRPGGQRVEGSQHARVVESAPASGQRRHQRGGGHRHGAQVLDVVEAGRQQGATALQIRGDRRLHIRVLRVPLGDQVVPGREHGADVGGQAIPHMDRQTADAPLEDPALGVQNGPALVALQAGDEPVQGFEQPFTGPLHLLVEAAQPLKGLDQGLLGPGDGRRRETAQAHEGGQQRRRASGRGALSGGPGQRSGCRPGQLHRRGRRVRSGGTGRAAGRHRRGRRTGPRIGTHHASAPLTTLTAANPSHTTPSTVPTTLSSTHARP